jgi:aspartate/methionine/tyrosine aminotransferase
VLCKSFLQSIVDIAKPRNIIIHCDEVYRPLFHGLSEDKHPPSILSFGYHNVLATSSLSKAYSLAGIRVGWIASRNPDIIERCSTIRDYTTISVSHIDQCVAAYALGSPTRPHLIARNLLLAQTNADMLDAFVIEHSRYLSWKRPLAGTTALIKVSRDGKLAQVEEFCKILQHKTGVMLLPADKGFGPQFKGFIRIGYVNDTDVMRRGLQEWGRFLDTGFPDVPLHS